MSIPAQSQRFGPYEIVSAIGKGGMGEVWRARDTRLGRDVAIKFSAQQFTDRFEREARAIAALNHPNICTLHNVGPNYLVMELIEGPTLADRIKEGPIPLEEALTIAKQIADALEAAHEKNIVHRDLKPANIKIRPDGSVKVLDFGLAKAGEAQEVTPDSPTIMPGTQMGMILGTAGYMSPEQARGNVVDKRADIWAFGVVLCEMVTAKRLFEGATISDSLAAVLKEEPDLNLAPEKIHRLLRACLEKDPRKRLRDIGDVWRLLEDPPAAAAQAGRARWIPWSVTAVLAALVVFGWIRTPQRAATVQNDVTLSIVAPSGKELGRVGQLHIDRISPDGSAVLLATSDGRFHVRRLDSLETELLPEFQAAGDAFWAPDSKSIAFSTANGLMKMRLPEGAPEPVTTKIAAARGGSWGDRGVILFATIGSSPGGTNLYSVSAAGGNATPVKVPGLTDGHAYNPEFLPGGEDFLFAFASELSQATQIYLATLRDGKAVDPTLLFNNDTAAAYTPAGGGRILFVRNDNLYAWKLDRKARKLTGEAELIQESVASAPGPHYAQLSVSRSGTIAWRKGAAVVSQLTVFDRQGNHIGVAGVPAPVDVVNLAPDEQHLFTTGEPGSWIVEANGPGRVFFSARREVRGFWSADGSRLIDAAGAKILEQNLSGATLRQLAEIPVREGAQLLLNDISPDGSRLLYGDQSSLYIYSLADKRSSEIVSQRVNNAEMSPDGAWIVYRAFTEPGIYVQPLSGKGLRRQIAGRGAAPVWRRDGKEILYVNQGKIWSVRVEGSGEQLRFGMPEALFSAQPPSGTNSGSRPLAVNRDGTRIFYLQSVEEPEAGVINVRTGAIR